jgi:hypothetical protein
VTPAPRPEPSLEELLASPHLQFNDAELLPHLLAFGPPQPTRRPERTPTMHDPRRPRPELPPTPLGFKLWFAFVAVLAVGFLGFVVWAVARLVIHYT